jgi:hypothetical protein
MAARGSLLETGDRAGGPEGAEMRFFEGMDRCHAAAILRAGEVDHTIEIAGLAVRLRLAGPGLAACLLPAFGHTSRADGADEGPCIGAWDTESTGVGRPEDPWSGAASEPAAEVRVRGGEVLWANFRASSGAATVVDTASRRGFFHVPDPRLLEWHERGAPLRGALHWLLMSPRRRLVHAGAVSRAGRGALIVGSSGSGKSTLALACLRSGLEYLGDDYVVLTGSEGFAVHSLYATAKASPASLAMLEVFDEDVLIGPDNPDPKAVLDLGARHLDRFRERAVVSAILIPRVTRGRAPAVRGVSASAAVRAVAPSTLLQHRGRDAEAMAMIAALARSVPSYTIEVGEDLEAAAGAVEELLHGGR